MLFDIDQSEGERFQFFTSTIDPKTGEIIYDDPVSDAWVTLRSMQPFFEERLSQKKQLVEHVHNPVTRQMERQTYYKELTWNESKVERDDAWDYSIVALENFKDKDGNIIECTRENKLKMVKIPVFDRFISRCFQVMSESGIIKAEDEKKT